MIRGDLIEIHRVFGIYQTSNRKCPRPGYGENAPPRPFDLRTLYLCYVYIRIIYTYSMFSDNPSLVRDPNVIRCARNGSLANSIDRFPFIREYTPIVFLRQCQRIVRKTFSGLILLLFFLVFRRNIKRSTKMLLIFYSGIFIFKNYFRFGENQEMLILNV